MPRNFVDNPPSTLTTFNIGNNAFNVLPQGFLTRLPSGIFTLGLAGIALRKEEFVAIPRDFSAVTYLDLTGTGLNGARLSSLLKIVDSGLARLFIGSNDLSDWLAEGTPTEEIAAAKDALGVFELYEFAIDDSNLESRQIGIVLDALNPTRINDINVSYNRAKQFAAQRLSKFTAMTILRIRNSGIDTSDAQEIVKNAPTSL